MSAFTDTYLIAPDREFFRGHPQVFGDLARAVAAVTEVGHRGHADPLGLSGLLVPVSEEPAVQFVVDQLLGGFGIAQRDGRTLSFSPNGLAPLLEEVGVALGAIEDEIKRVLIESDLCALRRHGKSSRSSRARESFDRPVVKETLRIRFSVLEHER